MDDMRDRYKLPGSEGPVHESLQHAYNPPPRRHQPTNAQRAHAPQVQPEPIQHPLQPAPAHPAANYRPKKHILRNLVILATVLAAGAGAVTYAYPKYISPNPFPAQIRQNAEISLLYPTKLPAGYQADKASFSLENNILIYSIADGGKKMVVTLQKTPTNFDFDSFYKQQLTGTQQFQTQYGQATIGKNNGHYLGSLPAGDTWLLISTNSPSVSMDDMSTVLQNLKKY